MYIRQMANLQTYFYCVIIQYKFGFICLIQIKNKHDNSQLETIIIITNIIFNE